MTSAVLTKTNAARVAPAAIKATTDRQGGSVGDDAVLFAPSGIRHSAPGQPLNISRLHHVGRIVVRDIHQSYENTCSR
jgi:hypothetical protein